jgi:hypothetical protein
MLNVHWELGLQLNDVIDEGQMPGESSYHHDAMTLSVLTFPHPPLDLKFSHHESLLGEYDRYLCTADGKV